MKNKEKQIPTCLKKFFDKFPNDATCWREATAELPDMHLHLAELYNDDRNDKYTKHLGYSKSPSECNTRHKKGIVELFSKLSEREQKDFIERYKDWLKI